MVVIMVLQLGQQWHKKSAREALGEKLPTVSWIKFQDVSNNGGIIVCSPNRG